MAYLIFALGLLGLCSQAWVWSAVILTLAFSFLVLRYQGFPRIKIEKPSVFLLGILGIGVIYAHVFWIPPFARDDMIYHLMVPKQMALTGKLSFDPFNINSNFPMLFEMPLAALQTWKLSLSPFLFNYAFGLMFVAVFYSEISRQTSLSRGTVLLASLTLATTPVLFDLLHTAYVEIFFSVLIVLACWAYFRHLDSTSNGNDWLQVCACLGLASAVKYPGCIFALIFFAYEFFRKHDNKKYYLGIALCATIAAPWYIKNWVWAGNPVFPFLNPIFGSPFISPTRFAGFRHMLVDYNMGRSIMDDVLLPIRLALGVDESRPPGLGFDGKLSLLFAIACAGLGWKEGKQRFASLLGLAYFAIWALESQQVRFLLPIIPVLAVFGIRRLASLPYARNWMLPLLVLIMAQNAYNIQDKMRKEGTWDLLSGRVNREQFLSRQMPISYGLAQEINRKLDPGRHKLMTVGSFGRNYYFDIPVLTNTFYDEEVFRQYFEKGKLEPDSVTEFFRKNGVTHILFNWGYVQRMHAKDTAFDVGSLEGYFRTRFRVEYQSEGLVLYAENF